MKNWPASCLAILLITTLCAVRADPFIAAEDMTVARSWHSSTLLPDGRVLIAGGDESGRRAELYDPETGKFVATGSLIEPRAGHTATLLPDGRVLIAGGGPPIVEFYDAATGLFTAGPQPGVSVWTATLLMDGRVLLAAGLEAELFDPETGTSRPAATFLQPGPWLEIFYDSATRLADGRVLFTGFGPSQLYDPARDRFDVVGPLDLCDLMVCGLELHTATLLANGKVLVAGGMNDEHAVGRVALAELFDPEANAFKPAGRLIWRRDAHAAVALADGRVLIVGGDGVRCDARDCYPGGSLAHAEIYDPASGAFAYAGELNLARTLPRVTLLKSGDVLITGGTRYCGMVINCYQPRLSSAELYRPRTSPFAKTLSVVEYYNRYLDRYFMTSDPKELARLEDGWWPGWMESGGFTVSASAAEGLDPVCAFSSRRPPRSRVPWLQWPVRFYTIEPGECEPLKIQYGWIYEGMPFYAARFRNGKCPPGMRILWRAFNNFSDLMGHPNHRYGTDLASLDAMVARGWIVEGPAMCVE